MSISTHMNIYAPKDYPKGVPKDYPKGFTEDNPKDFPARLLRWPASSAPRCARAAQRFAYDTS